MELTALCMPVKCSTTELHPQLLPIQMPFYLHSGIELLSLVFTTSVDQLNPVARTHFKDIYPHYC